MDIHLRNALRQYAAEPGDESAHKLARLLLRSVDTSDIMEQFYEAFWWLHEHPLFRYAGVDARDRGNIFPENLSIHVAKVDPETHRVEDLKSRNTHVEIWIEVTTYTDPLQFPENERGMFELPENERGMFGSWEYEGIPTHHYPLDCGADTYEEAIIKLAQMVYQRREYYPQHKPLPGIIPQLGPLTLEEISMMEGGEDGED